MDKHPSSSIPKESFETEPFSAYLDWAINNILGTYRHREQWYWDFERLDEAFTIAFNNGSHFNEALFTSFVFRARCTFRAACMIAMSGQTIEAYILIRGCLEAALYALHAEAGPVNKEAWLNRDKDDESRKHSKRRFKQVGVEATLKARSEWLHDTMQKLYDYTIDKGAHPNKRSITDGLRLEADAEKGIMSIQYVIGDSDEIAEAFKAISAIGLCALYILQLARPDYFKQFGIDIIIDEMTDSISGGVEKQSG